MAETLRGHAEELALLVNEKSLSQVALGASIDRIKESREAALTSGLGRQAAEATRLYTHYSFEDFMRSFGDLPEDPEARATALTEIGVAFRAQLREQGIISTAELEAAVL